ncbi:HEAT repeat domain-containing protein [Roseiconus lacunae]|uniref:HEAT repeat domain-containing protein n=1 Tax=Roseiconus lacunae TaxID=2605694 RepID=A0ABT7PDY4_9BACT|nr:HEAT repeat domain-containing protein [Roseiconus lacunae]MDM4014426.1 HEAT repeat domain-containing protein [Roseiconus lacunae]
MDDRDLDRMPNPFSPFADEGRRSRATFVSTLKWLVIAVVMFGVVSYGQRRLRKLQLDDLKQFLDDGGQAASTDPLHKIETLESDSDKAELLVKAMCSDDTALSTLASERLFELNVGWTTVPTDIQVRQRSELARHLTEALSSRENMPVHVQKHARTIAQAVFEDLIESPEGLNDELLKSRKSAIEAIAMVLDHDMRPSEVVRTVRESHPQSSMISQTDSSWTDWPPTSSTTPTIYRKQVASLDHAASSDVVLRQASGNDVAASRHHASQPRLVRPTVATSPNDNENDTQSSQREQDVRGDQIRQCYEELANPSRLVRLAAVVKLSKIDDPRVCDCLRAHLRDREERDVKVAHLIRNILDERVGK